MVDAMTAPVNQGKGSAQRRRAGKKAAETIRARGRKRTGFSEPLLAPEERKQFAALFVDSLKRLAAR